MSTAHHAKPLRGAAPHHFVDEEWLALRSEPVLEPDLPIFDPHHHLWDRRPHSLYLLPEILGDIQASGHHVRGTGFCDLALHLDEPGLAVVLAAIDNLGRGAAAQGLACLERMLGIAPLPPAPPVLP